MTDSPDNDGPIPAHGRAVAALLAGASALGLLLNHWMAASLGLVGLVIVGLGPMGLLLGIGGLIDPRILWSLGAYGEHLPTHYKIIGGALAVVGLLITLLLIFFVYPLGRLP